MLEIKNLSAKINDKVILNDVTLEMSPGEVLLITGHNGSGKSTLLHTIMGRPDINASGDIVLDDTDLAAMECHERAQAGVFMFHQMPPTIDGVNTMTLLNEINKIHDMHYKRGELIAQANDVFTHLNLPDKWSKRQFNLGASGGERKKNELAQAKLFGGKLLLLDEPDAGLEQYSRQQIKDLIDKTSTAGGYVMLVTHDRDLQEFYSKNKIELSDGRII
jgi:Fe-S cluster assembly ATP-binding protein